MRSGRKITEIEQQRRKKKSERRRKWELMLVGIIVLIIGIIGLIISRIFRGVNAILAMGFLGFGLSLLILGIIIILVAFWKIAHIEYGN